MESLAVKYRPKTFDDLSEQVEIKQILLQQLNTGTTKNAYLFCGGAGTGKTTSARIFANEINQHKGNPIELDAASHNSVDDVREIITQSKTQSLESEFKVFIIDECHSLSNQAWQAFLKVLEEPPKKSVFVFCTTDPQKIPKTILSRVQRYDFQRISHSGICNRLLNILVWEEMINVESAINDPRHPAKEAIDYIAKIADGGMRDAITMLDKCLAYSTDITLENVIMALGVTDYDTYINLFSAIDKNEKAKIIEIVDSIHSSGKDMKLFAKNFFEFFLDVMKYKITNEFKFGKIPAIYKEKLDCMKSELDDLTRILNSLAKLNAEIRWETNPKCLIESTLLLCC